MYRDLLTITQLMVLPPFVLSFSHFLGIIVLCSAKSPQSCLTLCDLLDHGPLSSPIHGILQARILEWVFPTQGPNLKLLHWQVDFYHRVTREDPL